MNALEVQQYHRLRKQGFRARSALSTVKVHTLFDRLKWAGLVRLRIEPDECCSYDDLAGDTFNRDVNPEIPEAQMKREEEAFKQRIESDGVWGIVGEYRLKPCSHGCESDDCSHSGWILAGSCWGYVGDDTQHPEIEGEHMQETIGALRDALKSRCPVCRNPRD